MLKKIIRFFRKEYYILSCDVHHMDGTRFDRYKFHRSVPIDKAKDYLADLYNTNVTCVIKSEIELLSYTNSPEENRYVKLITLKP